MTYRIMWAPIRWADDRHIELSSVGDRCEAVFTESQEEISDEQWATCDAIVSLPDIPEHYREKAKNCRIFVTPKVGYDNIDLEGWGKLGIPVCNVPDYGTMEVADHAFALMLSLVRSVTYHTRQLKLEPVTNWLPEVSPFARRLSDCTLGIVGIGRIGMATALRAKAFGMDVCFYDPYVENGRDKALGVRKVDTLREVFAQSDIVSLHTPLNAETEKSINADILKHSKENLILISTARGPIIDLDALYDAMKAGTIQAAGLDVLPDEPPNPAHPLISAWSASEPWIDHRLVITPHIGFNTPQSIYEMRYKGGACAAKYLTQQILENCINSEYL